MNGLVLLSVISLIGIAKAQNDPCDRFLECKQVMKQQAETCIELNKARNAEKPPKETERSKCIAEVREIKAPQRELFNLHSELKAACLSKNKDLFAGASRPPRKAGKCQGAADSPLPQVKSISHDEKDDKKQSKSKKIACKKSVRAMKKTCKQMARCCPSNKLCNLEYELSDVHDQIKQIRKDVLLKLIQCPPKPQRDGAKAGKQKGKGSGKNKKGKGKGKNKKGKGKKSNTGIEDAEDTENDDDDDEDIMDDDFDDDDDLDELLDDENEVL